VREKKHITLAFVCSEYGRDIDGHVVVNPQFGHCHNFLSAIAQIIESNEKRTINKVFKEFNQIKIA